MPEDDAATLNGPRLRRVLWIALAVNLSMFVVESASGLLAGSQALLADAIDFFSDAANYAITLAVLPLGLVWRMRAAQFKGACMLLLGLLVAARSAWALTQGHPPQAMLMGAIGLLALAANVTVAMLLYAYRSGDLNLRSVWICSRNDAIGNLAVLLAAFGVFGTGSAWPDLLVAAAMSALAIWSGWSILRAAQEARQDLALAAGIDARTQPHGTNHRGRRAGRSAGDAVAGLADQPQQGLGNRSKDSGTTSAANGPHRQS